MKALTNFTTLNDLIGNIEDMARQLYKLKSEMTSSKAFGSWLSEWFETYKKPYISKSQQKSIEICIRLHIPVELKDNDITSIDSLAIQSALARIASSKMRQLTYDVYLGAFRRAKENELIYSNPMTKVIKPTHRQNVGSPFSAEELNTLFTACSKKLKLYYEFICCTGARRSEALTVKWADICFEQGYIHLRGTKTKGSDRLVPIFADTLRVLNELPKSNAYLFDFTASYVTHFVPRVLPSHKLTDLRHTFATICGECDISEQMVKEWLGHTRELTTRRYMHIRSNRVLLEASKFKFSRSS